MNKIVHIAKYYAPHIGGVETHLKEVNKLFIKQGKSVTVICLQDDDKQKLKEKVKGVTVVRIPINSYLPKVLHGKPLTKFYLKLKLWTWMAQNSKYLLDADVVQVHDVMWWIWPLYMAVYYKLYLTFHGWEGHYPVRMRDKLHRYYNSISAKKTIHVGEFISKFYFDKPDYTIYGGVNLPKESKSGRNKNLSIEILSNKSKIVFLGRLESENEIDTYLELFKIIKKNYPKINIIFVGDGAYKSDCEKFGDVTGYVTNPTKYLKDASFVCANSYLSILDAQSYGKVVCSFYSHLLKKSYLETLPSAKLMVIGTDPKKVYKKLMKINKLDSKKLSSEIKRSIKEMSWQNIVKVYEDLWKVN